MFPFMILVTALAGFVGSQDLADEVAGLIVAAWPREVSGGIAGEIHKVLTTARGDILTIGAVFALYFASSGIESLRIGLNRAYGLSETTAVVAAAAGIDRLRTDRRDRPAGARFSGRTWSAGVSRGAVAIVDWLAPLESHYNIARFSVATFVLTVALLILHMWLPAGRRQHRRKSGLALSPRSRCGSPAASYSAVILRIFPTPT